MIRILGDGVAGQLTARALRAQGLECAVFGDGKAAEQPCALVHQYAGRSFRRAPLEEAAWTVARHWLDELVRAGAATALDIARPLASRAGDRLAASVEHANGVRRANVTGVGECLVYGPAFVVDVPRALATFEAAAAPQGEADILAIGAAWQHPAVSQYGGHLAVFEWGDQPLELVVSGGGIHLAPFEDGVCVGATFWPLDEPLGEAEAEEDLRRRAATVGVSLGARRRIWAGVRAVSDDRNPCVGRQNGQLVIGALGTRGWFWGPYCAKVAARNWAAGAPIPSELALDRFGAGT